MKCFKNILEKNETDDLTNDVLSLISLVGIIFLLIGIWGMM